jgi:essential nuclear protein 1
VWPRSFFIRVLLDKKYALPYRVLDALVEHFLRFQEDTRALPVVWHHSLLAFVQRYKREIAAPDKQRLKALLQTQRHYLVTPEVLRELADGQSRCVRCAGACSGSLSRAPSRAQRRGGAGCGDGNGRAGQAGGGRNSVWGCRRTSRRGRALLAANRAHGR